MSEHTPGPWRQNPDDSRFIETDEDAPANVARVLWIGDRKEADARLIAAAPKLLRLVRKSRALLVGYDVPDVEGNAFIEELEAVIAEVEGFSNRVENS